MTYIFFALFTAVALASNNLICQHSNWHLDSKLNCLSETTFSNGKFKIEFIFQINKTTSINLSTIDHNNLHLNITLDKLSVNYSESITKVVPTQLRPGRLRLLLLFTQNSINFFLNEACILQYKIRKKISTIDTITFNNVQIYKKNSASNWILSTNLDFNKTINMALVYMNQHQLLVFIIMGCVLLLLCIILILCLVCCCRLRKRNRGLSDQKKPNHDETNVPVNSSNSTNAIVAVEDDDEQVVNKNPTYNGPRFSPSPNERNSSLAVNRHTIVKKDTLGMTPSLGTTYSKKNQFSPKSIELQPIEKEAELMYKPEFAQLFTSEFNIKDSEPNKSSYKSDSTNELYKRSDTDYLNAIVTENEKKIENEKKMEIEKQTSSALNLHKHDQQFGNMLNEIKLVNDEMQTDIITQMEFKSKFNIDEHLNYDDKKYIKQIVEKDEQYKKKKLEKKAKKIKKRLSKNDDKFKSVVETTYSYIEKGILESMKKDDDAGIGVDDDRYISNGTEQNNQKYDHFFKSYAESSV